MALNTPFNTLPDSNTATFRTDSRTFFDREDSQREGEILSSFISAGGLHGITSSLTSNAFTTVAHVPERINQISASITYPTSTTNICWVIISSQNAVIPSWTRVGTTAYYFLAQGEGQTVPIPQILPANSAWLMRVAITGGAITTVTDLRRPASYVNAGVYNPMDMLYGAVGDNATNDTAAIQRAIDGASASSGIVYIPSGTFRIVPGTPTNDEGGSLTVAFVMRSNMHIRGDIGATFRIADSQSTNGAPKALGMFFTNAVLHDISIRGLIMDMNGVNNLQNGTNYNQSHISVSGTPGGVAARIDGMTLENNQFLNTAGTNCIVMAQSNTVGVTLGSRWTVRNNYFWNNGRDVTDFTAVYGWANKVLMEGNTLGKDDSLLPNTGAVVGYEVHGADQRIVNNLFVNFYRGMWVSSNLTSPIANIVIANNTFKATTAYGVDFDRPSANAQPIFNVVIANNIFEINDTNVPVQKVAVQMVTPYTVRDVLITGNVASKTDATISSIFVALSTPAAAVSPVTDITISGNEAYGFLGGVSLTSSSAVGMGRISVKDNLFHDLTVVGGSTPVGISVTPTSGTITSVEMTGNRIINAGYGIRLTGTISTVSVKANSYASITTANYDDSGATIANKHGDFDGTWTPVLNGFTQVLGGGAITPTGTYRKRGGLVTLTAKLSCTGGATLAAIAGTTSFLSNLPFTPGVNGAGTWVNSSTVADHGAVLASGTALYIATAWAADSKVWDITVTYPVVGE